MLVFVILASVVLVGCNKQTLPTDNTDGTTQWTDTETVDGENTDDTVINADVDALAQCLTDNGVIMYGTEWCSHCQNQKAMFGDSFEKVTFVDCDENKPACLNAWVKGFPTWVDAAGNTYAGVQSLERLANIAGCEE